MKILIEHKKSENVFLVDTTIPRFWDIRITFLNKPIRRLDHPIGEASTLSYSIGDMFQNNEFRVYRVPDILPTDISSCINISRFHPELEHLGEKLVLLTDKLKRAHTVRSSWEE